MDSIQQRNLAQIYPRNITGIYQGEWDRRSGPGKGDDGSVLAPWNANKHGRFLIQLRSTSLPTVPDLDFVYGVVKLYHTSSSETGVLFPIQGVFLASAGSLTLLSSSMVTERLYLELPKTDGMKSSDGGGGSSSLFVVDASTNSTAAAKKKRRKWHRRLADINAAVGGSETAPTHERSAGNLRGRAGVDEASALAEWSWPAHRDVLGAHSNLFAATGERDGSSGSSSSSSSISGRSSSGAAQHSSVVRGRGLLADAATATGSGRASDFVSVKVAPVIKQSVLIGSTGMKMHIVDMAVLVDASNSSNSGGNSAVILDPSVALAVGEALLPSSFKSLQRSLSSPSSGLSIVGSAAQPAAASSCMFSMQLGQPPLNDSPAAAVGAALVDSPNLEDTGANRGRARQYRRLQQLAPSSSASLSSESSFSSQVATPATGNATVVDKGGGAEDSESVQYASTLFGSMDSVNCGLAFNVSAISLRPQLMAVERKANTYSMLVSSVCIMQIALLLMQVRYSQTLAASAKISILCICGQAVLDACLCIAHLILSAALPNTFFGHFMWIAILKLLLFGVFEMRTVLAVYQARFSSEIALEGWDGLRRRLATMHLRFYAALFAAVTIALYFRAFPVLLVVLFYSFWVPQIVFNVVAGTRKALHPVYYMGTSLTRLFIPLYLLGCPKNFLLLLFDHSHGAGATTRTTASSSIIPYSVLACVVLVVWVGIQVVFLALQDMLGPRFCVPASMFPRSYDYYRPVPAHMPCCTPHAQPPEGASENDRLRPGCSINDTDADGAPASATSAPDIESGGLLECVICYNVVESVRGTYMITPCDHLFHKQCLSQWISIKLECPVCRSVLPVVEES